LPPSGNDRGCAMRDPSVRPRGRDRCARQRGWYLLTLHQYAFPGWLAAANRTVFELAGPKKHRLILPRRSEAPASEFVKQEQMEAEVPSSRRPRQDARHEARDDAIGGDGLEPERIAPILDLEVVLVDPFGPARWWRLQNLHRHRALPVGVAPRGNRRSATVYGYTALGLSAMTNPDSSRANLRPRMWPWPAGPPGHTTLFRPTLRRTQPMDELPGVDAEHLGEFENDLGIRERRVAARPHPTVLGTQRPDQSPLRRVESPAARCPVDDRRSL
jgi:hypothetical protein